MTPSARSFAEALHVAQPVSRLRSLVITKLIGDRLSRETVLSDLEELRADLENSDRIADEEAVLTVMDQIVGWCSPVWSLRNIGASEREKPLRGRITEK